MAGRRRGVTRSFEQDRDSFIEDKMAASIVNDSKLSARPYIDVLSDLHQVYQRKDHFKSQTGLQEDTNLVDVLLEILICTRV